MATTTNDSVDDDACTVVDEKSDGQNYTTVNRWNEETERAFGDLIPPNSPKLTEYWASKGVTYTPVFDSRAPNPGSGTDHRRECEHQAEHQQRSQLPQQENSLDTVVRSAKRGNKRRRSGGLPKDAEHTALSADEGVSNLALKGEIQGSSLMSPTGNPSPLHSPSAKSREPLGKFSRPNCLGRCVRGGYGR
eukprot:1202073-Amorphochlora_amoeboformis.AAC.1